jgi:XTP/dITP diphosphohydrolase
LKVILASRNAGKLREVRQILHPIGIEVVSLDEAGLGPEAEIEETGQTFEENALLKAEGIRKLTAGWVLADDSGLEVDALGGRPGVHSARYAGIELRGPGRDHANCLKVLSELSGVPEQQRTARFVCVLALVGPKEKIICRGACEGRIGTEPRGQNGFGYDPIFVPCGRCKTMAELTAEEKNAISHRGEALRQLARTLSKKP